MTHAWCHDVARDAAVRAAEDGRDRPLPTLGEAIARPFADAAERSSTVSKTGEGQSGLRTERVVLEITYDPEWCDDESIAERASRAVRDRLVKCAGESVRVVEDQRESHLDAQRGVIETLTRQRDAAIRERDSLRARVAHLEDANRALQDGWLNGNERKAVEYFSEFLDEHIVPPQWKVSAAVFRNLLARSSPPEVQAASRMTPEPGDDECRVAYIEGFNDAGTLWRASIEDLGVAVKEVGRE